MFEVEGEYTKATVYTNDIEESALKQIYKVVNHIAFKDSKIAIMPDVHKGKGICIGFTAELKDKIIPNVVGVDIGCGMYVVELGNKYELFGGDKYGFLRTFDKFINNVIPSGFNGYSKPQIEKDNELIVEILDVCNKIGLNSNNQLRKVGTLGGGNHFIELNEDENDNLYLVIHSGSRNFGYKVAKYFQEKANEYYDFRKQEEINKKIRVLKQANKEEKIEEEIKKIKEKYSIDSSLRFLEGQLKNEYLNDLDIAKEYAKLNREIIANKIIESFNLKPKNKFHTIHNYIDNSDRIIRKGAISSKEGEKVLIPFDMGTGSIIGIGKGNPIWNYSAPHGAGRVMSRRGAKDKLSFEEFKREMDGVYSTSIKKSTIDEAPGAYKNKDFIINNIKDTVNVTNHLKPIYNYKDN